MKSTSNAFCIKLRRSAVLGAALMWFGMPNGMAQPVVPIDPHRVYEQHCSRCHFEHAADLARQLFAIRNGRLQVKSSGRDVSRLLRSHHGISLSRPDATALLGLFEAGLKSDGVFQHKCARCHGRAVAFAREKLVLKDGQLRTRADDRSVPELLERHGGATAAEIEILLATFRRQLETVEPRP
jgi:cytochrome c5